MINIGMFIKYLHGLPDYIIYILLGLSAFVENLFPPIPGDTITAFGAFLVGTGRLDFFGVYFSTTFGSLLGFVSLYMVGGYLGRRFFIQKDYRFFKKEDIIKAEDWFRRFGYLIIALNRFLPGVRSVISITGGLSRLKAFYVVNLALLSCAVWNLVWISAGYLLGDNWDMVEAKITLIFARYNLAIFVLFMFIILFILIKRRFRR